MFLGYGKTLSSIVFSFSVPMQCVVCVACVCCARVCDVCVCVCGYDCVCVCIDCVGFLQSLFTLHLPTYTHIKYVPLTTRVCVCDTVCASCVHECVLHCIILLLRHCQTHVLYFLCLNTSIRMTSNVFPYYFFFLPTSRRGLISQNRVSFATRPCFQASCSCFWCATARGIRTSVVSRLCNWKATKHPPS
jgi:hypothetical protein